MITDERTRPKPPEPDGACVDCEFARNKFRDSCYCVKYGITIGYHKVSCGGYVREQVHEPENRA